MKSFLIALQFLTRIQLVKQTDWSDRDFGRSVAWFPLVGTIIGLFLYLVYVAASHFFANMYLAVIVIAAWFFITGGLHADGYMDTADGLFSGRSRERMLEIMKDSRVGSNGVMAFVFLVLLKVCFFANIGSVLLALVGIPTAARFGTLISIFGFPYARRQGLGRAFKKYAPSYTLIMGFLLALLPVFYGRYHYAAILGAAIVISVSANIYIVRKLGGVTGDTYGAVLEFNEMLLLGLMACIR